jgi:hypothetical protein
MASGPLLKSATTNGSLLHSSRCLFVVAVSPKSKIFSRPMMQFFSYPEQLPSECLGDDGVHSSDFCSTVAKKLRKQFFNESFFITVRAIYIPLPQTLFIQGA